MFKNQKIEHLCKLTKCANLRGMKGGRTVPTSTTDEKIEKLAVTIQKYLLGNPAILIGSGCSVPYGLPSMNNLSVEIVKQLEGVFSAEDSWKEFVAELRATNNLETALESVSMKEDIHDAIIRVVWDCINKNDNDAFLNFVNSGSYPDLTKIINKCVQSAASTNIITTNYDRLIEYSIDAAEGKCVSGFVGNYIKKFLDFDTDTTKRVINLFKVHGSVDWFKHKTNGTTIATSFHNASDYSDYYKPMIVTPGNMKYRETHNDPFRTVISEADKAIRASGSYLCVGYGFNDEHIQPIILDENRNKKKPIVIVTKGITPKMIELFHNGNESPCLIISEKASGSGACVYYDRNTFEEFDEPFWQLHKFSQLWLG